MYSICIALLMIAITEAYGDSHDCLVSAGYTYCLSKNKCVRQWEESCPICLNDRIWCYSSSSCYAPIGGYCEDTNYPNVYGYNYAENVAQNDDIPILMDSTLMMEDEHVCMESDDKWCQSKRECIDIEDECPECTNYEYFWCENEQKCVESVEMCPVSSSYNGDNHGCLSSAGYTYCRSKNKCLKTWEETCPICLNNKKWCYSSNQCYYPLGGYCEDTMGTMQYGAKKVNEVVMDKVDNKNNYREIIATATFKSSESGVEGEVKVDENGNIFLNLDIKDLDISPCKYNENELISFKYAIRNKWDYGIDDFISRNGPDQCNMDISGSIYNPFRTPLCTEYKKEQEQEEYNNMNMDMYFKCAIGDLSGKFGEIEPDDNNKLIMEQNVSEQPYQRLSGFCLSRLTPESLVGRSFVFSCKDTFLFCAPFRVHLEQNM